MGPDISTLIQPSDSDDAFRLNRSGNNAWVVLDSFGLSRSIDKLLEREFED